MTAIDTLTAASPPDDAGADTADRYDWQALTAAVDALSMILGAKRAGRSIEDVLVVCEYHEDYVLCDGDSVLLVSVKHRESGAGSWTFAPLFTDGGLAHLFLRWCALSEDSRCRLVTNVGLRNGEPARLSQICERLRTAGPGPRTFEESEMIRSACARILDAIPADKVVPEWAARLPAGGRWSQVFEDAVTRFLGILSFDCDRVSRHHLPAAAAAMYMRPVLQELGIDDSLADAAWETVSGLFRERMRGRTTPAREAMEIRIRSLADLTPEARECHRAEDRAIAGEDILRALAIARDVAILPVPRGRSMAPTRLAIKLVNAGCHDTTVHAAEAAARQWREYELDMNLQPGTAQDLARLKVRTLLAVSDLHERCAEGAEQADYGPVMWRMMRDVVREPRLQDGGGLFVDDELILGLVCDLTSECKVWFSDYFDIDAGRDAFPNRLEGETVTS
ncbi:MULTISPECIES: dsDNA nuclease domain-containing protein [Cellulomonas]|uniref:Uncharacterized protein n=1 Tax=Cellulomonas gelida TaxID=1712 RepID=A0A4Y3KPL6_9CELL|nr:MULTISPECIES: dsDNA nuclease domain-containing protein [Cellulomonas]MCR6705665.1 dsDNA nuclease domain-containing protein [Cellulomonas sp.]GEA84818.1 hypothetical protein CGE01nite_20690 [Cellulomonas gelida]GGL16105.1 hypothetical protein GCM10009774_03120 [Cellulomonas gelida]